MPKLNPREEIISLMRGYYATPILSCLGQKGILKNMMEPDFTLESFPTISNKNLFLAILKYLVQIGLLTKKIKNKYSYYNATDLGQKVFKRYGSFCLIHSYFDYMENLDSLLFDPFTAKQPQVNRLENVIGSGQTHSRKFFVKAFEMIADSDIATLIDIGCGDGKFLSSAISAMPHLKVVAIDKSEVALKVTVENLSAQHQSVSVDGIWSDGLDVPNWTDQLKEKNLDRNVAISLWFLLHEISKGKLYTVSGFLNEIYQNFPHAEIIVGEIVNVPSPTIATNRYNTALPEFLFFHDISGQGILSWDDYQECLKQIPYDLVHEARMDEMSDENGNTVPSSFVWHLKPKS